MILLLKRTRVKSEGSHGSYELYKAAFEGFSLNVRRCLNVKVFAMLEMGRAWIASDTACLPCCMIAIREDEWK